MKYNFKHILLSIAAGLAIAALMYGQSTVSRGESGRYQLISSPYSIWLKSGSSTETTVFRIDTATGKTWKYVTGHTDDSTKPMNLWQEIDAR